MTKFLYITACSLAGWYSSLLLWGDNPHFSWWFGWVPYILGVK